MIIIPLGSNYQRSRSPKLTIGIIIACTIVYFLTFYAQQIKWTYDSPRVLNLEEVEYELMNEYLRQMDENEARKIVRNINYNPRAYMEFKEEFETAMREGRVVPLDSQPYREWEQALAELERARRGDPWYIFGYVPADRGLLSLITCQFLHGSFMHLFWNMVFLWITGPNLEDVWGRKYFLIIYLMGGVVAAISQTAAEPGSYGPMIGASGAIAAAMGAFAVRFYYVKFRFGFFSWSLWVWAWIPLALWFAREVYWGIRYMDEYTGVATWAHVGGFAFGAVAAFVLRRARAEETFIAGALAEQDQKMLVKQELKQAKKATPTGSDELKQGIQARKVGRLEEARGWLEAAVANDPDDFEACEELIRLLFLTEDLRAAGKVMGTTTERLLASGDADRALHWYNEIVRLGLYDSAMGTWTLAIAHEFERRQVWDAAVYNYRRFGENLPAEAKAPKALFVAANMMVEKTAQPQEAVALLDLVRSRYPDWMPDAVEHAREMALKKIGS